MRLLYINYTSIKVKRKNGRTKRRRGGGKKEGRKEVEKKDNHSLILLFLKNLTPHKQRVDEGTFLSIKVFYLINEESFCNP